MEVSVSPEKRAELPIHLRNIDKDLEKISRIDRGIVFKQLVKNEISKEMEEYFKPPKSYIKHSIDLDDIKRNFDRKVDYFREMKKEGNNIIESFAKTYGLLKFNEVVEMKDVLHKFLIHQKDFLQVVHKDIKNFMIMYKTPLDKLKYMSDRVNYEYMLIVCLMLLIMRGVSLERIDKIDLAKVENLLNLKGYDKRNDKFVKVIKVKKNERVLVKNGVLEYELDKDELIMSDYLRVKVVGSHIYKGNMGKLTKIESLSVEEVEILKNRKRDIMFKFRDNLTQVERLALIEELKKIEKDLDNDKIGVVLLFEGDIHQKLVKINMRNLKLNEIDNEDEKKWEERVKELERDIKEGKGDKDDKKRTITFIKRMMLKDNNKKLLEREVHLNLRMDDVKEWGNSIIANIYKAYNNLMIDRRNALGLGYFRIMYNKMVRQMNEYYKFVNGDIKKRNKMMDDLKILRKRLRGKKGKMEFGEKDRVKGQVIRLENMIKKHKYIRMHGSIRKKEEIKRYKKYPSDFDIKGDSIYLKKNDKDFKRMEKVLGKLNKVKEEIKKSDREVDFEGITIDTLMRLSAFKELINKVITGEYLSIELVNDPQIEIVRELVKNVEEEYEDIDDMDEDELMKLLEGV